MATNTPNYGLVKPSGTEVPDIAVINGNMDKIDLELKANATNIGLLEGNRSYHFRWSSSSTNWQDVLKDNLETLPIRVTCNIWIMPSGNEVSLVGGRRQDGYAQFLAFSYGNPLAPTFCKFFNGTWTFTTL